MGNFFSAIFAGGLVAIGIAYETVAWGTVIYYAFDWFIRPVFEMQSITFVEAIGLGLFIGLFNKDMRVLEDEVINKSQTILNGIFSPWLTLLLMYIFYVNFM